MTSGFQVPNAVQLRVSIDRIEPQIWRRVIVPSSFNLRDLHLVLQAAFGWMNAHLHEFEIGGLSYGEKLADAERGELLRQQKTSRDLKRQPLTPLDLGAVS